MVENEVATIEEEAKKSKKSMEELNADAKAARDNIRDYQAQIKALQVKLAKEEKTVKQSRSRRRTHKAMVLYGTLIKIMGYQDEESMCATDEEFEMLHNRIIKKVKRWMKNETGETEENGGNDNIN